MEPSPEGLDSGRAAGGAGLRLDAERLELGCPTAGAGGSCSPRVGIRGTSLAEQKPTLELKQAGLAGWRRRVFVSLKLMNPINLFQDLQSPGASLSFDFLCLTAGLAPSFLGCS